MRSIIRALLAGVLSAGCDQASPLDPHLAATTSPTLLHGGYELNQWTALPDGSQLYVAGVYFYDGTPEFMTQVGISRGGNSALYLYIERPYRVEGDSLILDNGAFLTHAKLAADGSSLHVRVRLSNYEPELDLPRIR